MPELKPLPCPLCGEIPLVNPVTGHILCCKIVADDIYAWSALPRALTWTTEPPKVAGWYWLKDCSGVTIMDLRKLDGLAVKIKQIDGWQWAGPIVPPVEG